MRNCKFRGSEIAGKLRRYFLVRTFASILTGLFVCGRLTLRRRA